MGKYWAFITFRATVIIFFLKKELPYTPVVLSTQNRSIESFIKDEDRLAHKSPRAEIYISSLDPTGSSRRISRHTISPLRAQTTENAWIYIWQSMVCTMIDDANYYYFLKWGQLLQFMCRTNLCSCIINYIFVHRSIGNHVILRAFLESVGLSGFLLAPFLCKGKSIL